MSLQQPYLNSISVSLKGYSHFCLLQYEQARVCYSQSLAQNPFDSTTLFRRANLYLKVNQQQDQIKEYEKAACDIFRLFEIQPESMRIGVLVMEIKDKARQVWKAQTQKDPFKLQTNNDIDTEDDIDSEEALNFSNLKNIDRCSQKQIKSGNKRISQINFGQDEMIEYEQSESQQMGDSKIGRFDEDYKDKMELQELELNSVQQEDQPSVVKFVISKNMKKPKKSILKCSIAYKLPPPSQIDTINTCLPIDASRVKDIDGKKIQSSKFIRFSLNMGKSEILRPNPGSKPRKSCIKNTSMIIPASFKINQEQKPRVSARSSRHSFGELKNLQGKMKVHKKHSQKESSGDESDEYNIFGNKGQKQLDEQLQKIKIGPSEQEHSIMEGQKSFKPKKSILKPRNFSVIQKDKSQLQSNINKKKSVIFK